MSFAIPLVIVLAISVLGLAGGALLIYRERWSKRITKHLINFAIGALFSYLGAKLGLQS